MTAKRVVLKVGTNVLQRPNGKLDYNIIRDLCDQVMAIRQQGHEVFLVSSGAVGAGREYDDFAHEPDSLKQRQMMAAVGQVRLLQIYSDFFLEHHTAIAQILVSRSDFANQASFLSIRNTLEGLLKSQLMPVINGNDVVSADELRPMSESLEFSDNDRLALYIAALVEADVLFFLTTTPGILTQVDEDHASETISEVQNLEEVLPYCNTSISSGGTGGMLHKARTASEAAQFGMDAFILSGKDATSALDALAGNNRGTHFVRHGNKLKSFAKWLQSGVLDSEE